MTEFNPVKIAADITATLNKGTIIIIRGLPGTGKSTLAKNICASLYVSSATFESDYWMGMMHDPKRLGACHAACLKAVDNALSTGTRVVFVTNTNTQLWEFAKYIECALMYLYDVRVINLFDMGMTDEVLAIKNIHNVPLEKIHNMRTRYQQWPTDVIGMSDVISIDVIHTMLSVSSMQSGTDV